MAYDLTLLTADELWAVHDYVRQHDKLGQEWDKDFHTRVMAALLAAEGTPNRQAGMLLTEDELWQLDRQIPSAMTVGTQPVGRNLLRKVMKLLVKIRQGDDDDAGTRENRTHDSTGSSARTETAS